ncbi:hypothetical protein XCR1_1560003 [Xenorhabdus cabanillasii JM26]|uniref:Uncharacterized protein n=1 Tax=Xenorhabdus cabanillasii JM26 TaxID=1427517 RepID=W1IQ83_9GAMM|nr:hypothetical protein Xcab_01076 [Xenorhabdus cabanillasii JM26]CDL80652.1 hypothetical protein XCR1_1560003 [Xenorhabdus cabanillasii JM26]
MIKIKSVGVIYFELNESIHRIIVSWLYDFDIIRCFKLNFYIDRSLSNTAHIFIFDDILRNGV